ncbi:Protein of unknown function DUF820 [Crocosphaera watsonii WH 0005]|uniref:Uncharacterized protein n=1 Tax=Crocosphaera watsonii WH 0005 TaxID=423472 RepID=T2J2F2_CROWT|nr:Protein of unknown function DUF820 [Crocosphaera watsonii WH 0005]
MIHKLKKITVFYPDSPPETKQGNDSLGDDLLPDLSLTPQYIFEKADLIDAS